MKKSGVHQKSIQNIKFTNWNKIKITDIWGYKVWEPGLIYHWETKIKGGKDTLIYKIEKSNKLINENNRKFVSENILKEFKKYTNPELYLKIATNQREEKRKIEHLTINDKIASSWYEIAEIFGESEKIFVTKQFTSEHDCLQSQGALKFLQLIINKEHLLNIIYRVNEIIELEEWINDQISTDIMVEKLSQGAENNQTPWNSNVVKLLTEIKLNLDNYQEQIQQLKNENQQLQVESKQLDNSSVLSLIEKQLSQNELVLVQKTQQLEQLKEKAKQLEEKLNSFRQTQIIHNPPKFN